MSGKNEMRMEGPKGTGPKEGGFHHLGKSPKNIGQAHLPEKTVYPMVHDIGPDNYPPLKDMKLGGTGHAHIKYRIAKHGGIEITHMKHMKSDANEGPGVNDNDGDEGGK